MSSPFQPRTPCKTWIVWGETTKTAADVAEELGSNAQVLLDWLECHAPAGGGRLRGQPCRLASPEEVERAELEAAEVRRQAIATMATRWIRWHHPDGTHESLSMAQAAGRLINERDRAAAGTELAAYLLDHGGVFEQGGHRLEPITPPPKNGPRRTRRREKMTENESQSHADESNLDNPPHQPSRRSKGSRLALSSSAAALLEQTAAAAGLSPDDALMALLPASPAMAAVLGAVEREQLAQLTDLDWTRLQAIARTATSSGEWKRPPAMQGGEI